MSRRYAILGAGALGLTAGLRLAQRGNKVVVFEREPLPGGLAAGFQLDATPAAPWLEKFYHHLFESDRRAVAMIEELGLGPLLEWHRPRTVTLVEGHLRQLDSPTSLLRFTPLPVLSRVRMGVALAYLRALRSPSSLEGRTAVAWIRHWMGDDAGRVVWEPLLRGKFGAAADSIAMPWFWARVHDRTARLGYLRGGFQQLYERLAERIAELGGEVRLETTVAKVTGSEGAFRLRADGAGEPASETFDRVVSTLPTRLTARLVDGLGDDYLQRHDPGPAYGAQCLILALDRPLTDAYWINVNDPGFPFMAAVEHTNMLPAGAYGNRHLIYLGNYKPMDDPFLRMERHEVVRAFLPHLARLNPAFRPEWVTESWMFVAPFAQPIVTPAYRSRIPPFRTPLAGLWSANMFQVYPHDRGQNYSIELAERLVAALTS